MRWLLTQDEPYSGKGCVENPYRGQSFRISVDNFAPFRLLQRWCIYTKQLRKMRRYLPGVFEASAHSRSVFQVKYQIR